MITPLSRGRSRGASLPAGLPVEAPTVAGLALAALLGMAGAFALSPLLPLLAADLGSGVAVLGQAIALLNLLAAGLGLALGPLGDTVGARRLLLAGLLAVAGSALACAAAGSVGVVLLAAALGALGRAAVQPMAFAIAAARFEGDARRRAISWTQAGVSGATLAGLPLLAAVAAGAGWRGALGALAALALIAAALEWRILPPDGRSTVRREAAGGPEVRAGALLRAYAPLVRHRPALGVAGATLLGQLGFWATLTYLGAFLVQVHGLGVSQAGAGYLASGLGLLLGNIAASGPLGRRPLRPLLILGRLAQAPLLGAALLPGLGPGLCVALMLLAGWLHGAGTALGMTLIVAESPSGRATTVTLNQSALTLGVALASAAGGLLLGLGGYPLLALAVPLPNLLAALCLWATRPHVPGPA
jgi:predicted MFS family arabinose efflux permease